MNEPDPNCKMCGGQGWVCENHADKPWGGGEGDCGDGKPCGGAGMLCSCNPQTSGDPEPSDG